MSLNLLYMFLILRVSANYSGPVKEGKMKVDVILPAAGTSERMNLPVAKQFIKVLGKHILAYTVDCFHRFSWVRHIVVTVSADQIEFTKEMMKNYGFSRVMVCAGSHTRHRSIFCGLKALASECSDSDVIIIHDAARPIVSEQVARQVAEAAMSHGASGVTRPLVSTVIRGDDDDDRLVESLDRRLYRNSEMPQAFHYSIITSAYKQSSEDDLDYGTECLLLALKYSKCQAALVKGTDDLWKVTYQKDIYSMESVVKEKFMVVSVMNNCGQKFLALKELKRRLYQRQLKIAENADIPANTFVVVCDWQSANSLGSVADKISNLYKQDMPSSAVKLDLMVVMVFLQGSHFTVSQAHTLVNENMSAESLHDGERSGDQRNSEHCFNGDAFNSPAKTLNSDSLLCCSNAKNHSSGKDNSNLSCATTRCSPQQLHKHGDVTVSHNDPNLSATSYCKNMYSSLEDNTHFSLAESQGSDIFKSVDSKSQQECSDRNFKTCSTNLEMPVLSSTVNEQIKLCGDYKDTSRCQTVIRAMKDKLQRNIDGKSALVVGVLCEIKSTVGEQLAELIWQRSLFADGQILTFDNCLS